MSKQHKNILDPEIHNPKDFNAASNDTVLSKDSFGNLTYVSKNDVGGSVGPQGAVGPAFSIQNIVIVQKTPQPGQFSTVEAALASITDASSTNRYVIQIGPGIYLENQLILKQYIYLVGSSMESIILEPINDSISFIIGSQDSLLRNLTIRNVLNSTAIECNISGGTFFCDNILMKDNQLHVDVKVSTGTRSKIDMFRCIIKGSSTRCIQIISDASITAKCVLNECIVEQEGTGDGIFIDGMKSNLIINGGEVDGETTGSVGLTVQNGALVESFGTEFERWDKGIVVNNVGVFPHLAMGSILFEANTTKDIQIDHLGTSGNLSGTLTESKVTISPTAPMSIFYVDPTVNGIVSVGKFKIGDSHNKLVDASKLIQRGFTHGVLEGGDVSVVTGLQIQVAAGNGFYEIETPHRVIEKNWITQTLIVPDNTFSYIYFDNSGTLVATSSHGDTDGIILLGRVVSHNGTILVEDKTKMLVHHYGNRVEEYLREAIGAVYSSGSKVSENSTPFKLDVTPGKYFFATSKFQPIGGTGLTFTEVFRDGLGSCSYLSVNTVFQKWDDNSGSLVAISVGKFVKHAFYVVGEGSDEKYFLVYGQEQFNDIVSAQEGVLPLPPASFIDGIVVIAHIIVDDASANIFEIKDKRPVIESKASGVSAASDHGNLTGLADVADHPDYVTMDGSRAMDALTLNGGANINLGATQNVVIDGKTNPRNVTLGVFRFLQKPNIPSTRVLNIDIDVNGQNDTMAIVNNYKATGLGAGDVNMIIENNIDTANSTGGTIEASRTSKIGAGTIEVRAIAADPGVNVIHQNKGTFGAVDTALTYDGAFTDVTANFNSGASDVQLFVNVNNLVYIGCPTKFDALELLLSINSSHNIGATFEYSLGAGGWSTFGPGDSTNGFTNQGLISWDSGLLAGWAVDTINAVANKFWIRITRTAATVTTPPTESTIQQTIITQYNWDKEGDLSINNISSVGNISVSGTVDGRDIATDGVKLDGIEAGATADLIGSEIKTLYEGEADTNAYNDAAVAKLAGITAGANVVNPMTTQGDVIYGGASGVQTRLAKGLANQVLTMNPGATAPIWAASGITYNYIESAVLFSTVSTIPVIVTSFTLTPPAGVWLALSSLNVYDSGDKKTDLYLEFHKAAVVVPSSTRKSWSDTTGMHQTVNLMSVITTTGVEAIDVRAYMLVPAASILSIASRSLTLIKVG